MTKQQWRGRLLDARRRRSAAERSTAQRRITEHALAELTGLPPGSVICAYLPLPSEPLAPDLPHLLVRTAIRVLVPVARPAAPLDWCDLGGPVAPGVLGISEPLGPRLGPSAISAANVVLVPALAVDHAGIRLGRGGGHYDRSLALIADRAATRVIAVVFDEEVVQTLPSDAHDVPVAEVLTPSGGVRHVARNPRSGASSD